MRWRDLLLLALSSMAAGCARPLPERVLTRSRDGWTRTAPLMRYGPGNLYEYIDGEADAILPFGFRSLTQGTYRRGEAESVQAEADGSAAIG